MFQRIDHVAVHVSDLERSVRFYERHFDFKGYFRQVAGGGLQIAYLKLGDTVWN
jgi:catechol 2,3-dioxygenase-like lactoylglutathione lyase family enzyme